MNAQTVRYWPTDKAYAALGGKSHTQVDRDLAADLRLMDREGAINLDRWPAARAFLQEVEKA